MNEKWHIANSGPYYMRYLIASPIPSLDIPLSFYDRELVSRVWRNDSWWFDIIQVYPWQGPTTSCIPIAGVAYTAHDPLKSEPRSIEYPMYAH